VRLLTAAELDQTPPVQRRALCLDARGLFQPVPFKELLEPWELPPLAWISEPFVPEGSARAALSGRATTGLRPRPRVLSYAAGCQPRHLIFGQTKFFTRREVD
jgi:hypothetical protein